MAAYDILGNIVIFKFKRGTKQTEKKKIALRFLKEHKGIATALEKSGRFKGRLRTHTTKFVAGVKNKEALYRENGCEFRFNVDSCYFSPRLSSDRMEVAKMVGKKERVLVMFGGVGPYAIVIARVAKPKRVVSVELGRECSKYALENMKRNKVNVEVVQGDVRKKVPGLGKFDRIMMARPNLKDSFLDVGFRAIKKGGIIHYHGFYDEEKVGEMKELFESEAKKAKRKIKILGIKKAGDIGVKRYRYRADIRLLN